MSLSKPQKFARDRKIKEIAGLKLMLGESRSRNQQLANEVHGYKRLSEEYERIVSWHKKIVWDREDTRIVTVNIRFLDREILDERRFSVEFCESVIRSALHDLKRAAKSN